ncbi:hypothetical protein CEV31_4331 [Brucella thiophenivorans]|uniref:Uncharacterized protein n=2 Tax=Brucella thiophenivorans TaxID=571255 RepID=A0A256FRZ2_9HYPH|nr:hypothetical protein CEV31_4331 [Brucella thiophenivorans]
MAAAFSMLTASTSLSFANYNDAIAGFEGGNDYSIMNQGGSSALGRYQITAGTWADLGYLQYNGGSKSDYGSYSFTDKAISAGVGSVSDLRNSSAGAALQDRANQELAARNWASMNSGVRDLVGQTINGVTITQDGLLSASHFLGAGALNKWVASGFDPSVLPAEYLKANGFKSYEELQAYIMKRITGGAGNSAFDGIYAGGGGVGMYDGTSGFPGIGNVRPVLIRENPPFQGERKTLL